jgi:hypothetical protein
MSGRRGTDRPLRLPARHGYGLVRLLVVVTYVLALLADRRWIVTVLLFLQTGTGLAGAAHVAGTAGSPAGRRRGLRARAGRQRRTCSPPGRRWPGRRSWPRAVSTPAASTAPTPTMGAVRSAPSNRAENAPQANTTAMSNARAPAVTPECHHSPTTARIAGGDDRSGSPNRRRGRRAVPVRGPRCPSPSHSPRMARGVRQVPKDASQSHPTSEKVRNAVDRHRT